MSNVAKAYDEHTVLNGLDLEISAGEVFALLGPNGAGKTTAVEILEGYRRADEGLVEVLGFDPADADPEFRSRIGIVLQQTTSFERSTARETVEMFASLYPNPLSVEEALRLVDLDHKSQQIAQLMSGGQRRRLDVACGLVGRPELLFLDEPTTGLDPQARRSMWEIIKGLRDAGTTVLLTTHYLEEAEVLADRVGILLDGQLQQVASPNQIGQRDEATARLRFVPPKSAPADFVHWERDGNAVVMSTDEPGVLVGQLVERYGELEELTITRPTLEDVYLELVSRSESTHTGAAQ